jgi:hypothetical protein
MKRILYNTLLILLCLAFVLSDYSIINVSVSLKYETNNGCISLVDGTNLCLLSNYYKIAGLLSGIVIILLVLFKKKLTNKSISNNSK